LGASQRRDQVVSRFLGHPVARTVKWTPVSGPLGPAWLAYIPGSGVFTTDGAGSVLLTAALILPSHTGSPLDDATLLGRARTFAASKVSLKGLSLYRTEKRDRGQGTMLIATWRQKLGSAWLPKLVTVAVDNYGRPAEFGFNPTSVSRIDTSPTINAAAAARAASAAAGSNAVVAKPPELDVVGPPKTQPRLVWIVDLSVGRAPQVPTVVQLLVDARTGRLVR
jgi:hypothetical protein